jgi:hypothetical protein
MSGTLALLLCAALQDDPVERSLSRYKESLRLSDEQSSKARDIIKKQQEDLRALLTDEQKTRYDEMLRGGGGGGRGNAERGVPPGQARRGGWYPSTDDMKTGLGLTDEQAAKVNEVRDGVREEMRRMFQNRDNRPGPEAFEKLRADTTAKIRELLNDEQKGKFDELMKSFQTPTPGADRGGERGGPRGGSVDERVARAMEVLKFEKPEEAEAVKGLVRKVVELQEKVETTQRENRGKYEELQRDTQLSEEAIGDKLAELRKAMKEYERQLADARAQLIEVISSRQEVELLRRGVLR